MKKFLLTFAAIVAVSAVAFAGTVTNQMGQVFNTTASDGVSAVATVIPGGAPTPTIPTYASSGIVGYRLDTNVYTVATAYTPRFIQDELVSTVSGMVWRAYGTTTNSWILLK